MQVNIELKYVGHINLKSVRDFILDNKLTEYDTVLLNVRNFDQIVLDYRDSYKKSIQIPFRLLGVFVEEEREQRKVPFDRIGLVKNDVRNRARIKNEQNLRDYYLDSEELVYRCGWCGNLVGEQGEELDPMEFEEKKKLLNIREAVGYIEQCDGYCCKNERMGDDYDYERNITV